MDLAAEGGVRKSRSHDGMGQGLWGMGESRRREGMGEDIISRCGASSGGHGHGDGVGGRAIALRLSYAIDAS